MDTRTGQIYDTREEAAAAGVPEEHLVTGPREALEELAGLVKRKNLACARRKRKGDHEGEARAAGSQPEAQSVTDVKALTICQPYAELIARGVKPIENRTWPTAFRGAVAIHAGKSRDWLDEDDEKRLPGMAFGAVVAVATLYDCVELARLPADLANHEHANGPWCWLLKDVRRLPTPVPMKGALGLWDLPKGLTL